MTEILYKQLSFDVVGAAMEVHRNLGPGFRETIYQRALEQELSARGIPFERQKPLPVYYKETLIGECQPDLIVDEKIIVEIKAASTLTAAHRAQALQYLAATNQRLTVLLNFGAPSLEFKRIIR